MTVQNNLFAASPDFFLVCQETKGNIKDSILIDHLSGSEISCLKISCIHRCGRVLWTERASLKSFVHEKKIKKIVQMCQLITLSEIWFLHTVLNFLSDQTGFLSSQDWPWPDQWPSCKQKLFAGLLVSNLKITLTCRGEIYGVLYVSKLE